MKKPLTEQEVNEVLESHQKLLEQHFEIIENQDKLINYVISNDTRIKVEIGSEVTNLRDEVNRLRREIGIIYFALTFILGVISYFGMKKFFMGL